MSTYFATVERIIVDWFEANGFEPDAQNGDWKVEIPETEIVISLTELAAAIAGRISQLQWERGFPPESGSYLVELEDGEHCITPYQAERRWVEQDQDWDNRTGWVCLTHSRARVIAWAVVPKFKVKVKEVR